MHDASLQKNVKWIWLFYNSSPTPTIVWYLFFSFISNGYFLTNIYVAFFKFSVIRTPQSGVSTSMRFGSMWIRIRNPLNEMRLLCLQFSLSCLLTNRIPSCVEAGSVLTLLPNLYGDFVLLHGERTLFVTKGGRLWHYLDNKGQH
jgi:hypothetical protein